VGEAMSDIVARLRASVEQFQGADFWPDESAILLRVVVAAQKIKRRIIGFEVDDPDVAEYLQALADLEAL
jgi:hypothetical protein